MKKISLFLVLFLSLILNVNADAKTNNLVDFNKKGLLEITLSEKEDNSKISGAEITIYKVADAKEKDHNLVFQYVDNFKCSASLDNLESKELTNEINKCINDNTTSFKKVTNKEGKVTFDNLDLGLYIVKQTNKVKGYSQISPYLISIPKVLNNEWTYNIVSKPKTEILKLIDLSVTKVWNTKNSNKNDKNNLPSYIEVALLKDEIEIDRVLLNSANDWKYTWEDMAKSDGYSVKEVKVPKGYTVSYQEIENGFIITNTTSLVQTGQLTYLVLIIGGLGLVLTISGILYNKKVNNE